MFQNLYFCFNVLNAAASKKLNWKITTLTKNNEFCARIRSPIYGESGEAVRVSTYKIYVRGSGHFLHNCDKLWRSTTIHKLDTRNMIPFMESVSKDKGPGLGLKDKVLGTRFDNL